MRFITKLLDAFFPPRVRALRARTVSHAVLAPLIQPLRLASVAPAAIALLPYRNPLVQAAITEAKFNDSSQAQEALGAVLADYLSTLELERPHVLVPVPLSKKRKKARGYNQAERICRAAHTFSIDTKFLGRTRDTPPQTGLGGKERRKNLEGAFAVLRPPEPDTLYIVVDDVITTGATLAACVAALRAAGAVYIRPVALAHSP